MSSTKDISAIYTIKNLVNGKFYIGSAVFFHSRKRTHLSLLRRGKHQNRYIQRAFDKYGEAAFEITIVEVVDNKNDLLTREQFWMDEMKPDYNMCKTAGSILGVRFSEESKRRLSEMRTGEKNCNYGKSMPEDVRQKLRVRAFERMDDARKLMHREFHRTRMKPIIQKTLDGKTINEFECIRDAARATGFNRAYISQCCKGNHEKAYGYKWQYKNLITG